MTEHDKNEDAMKVTLISYTKPVSQKLLSNKVESVQELIAYVARVSNPDNQFNNMTAEKLITYLIKHKHWSPLEMVDLTFEIETTRDIGRQFIRHWSLTPQEFSQRYANVTDLGEMFEYSECRLQDTNNRQNSIIPKKSITFLAKKIFWYMSQVIIINLVKFIYLVALKFGIAKEVARKILPEGLTKTRMYMKGSVRDWIHYLSLRTGNGTQKEHIELAKEIAKVMSEVFPVEKYI
jgi:thymidylate synthase (FAD)